jgi:excisionase family DNA binding protein
VDLRTAAQRMSVHYQTAYRWVRAGSLAAVKIGASYEIAEEELERFLAVRRAPVPPPARTQVRSWEEQADRFHERLLAGDELACRGVIDRLHQGGIGAVVLCELLLAPAMARIGDGWAAGRVSVAVEHRAAELCQSLIVRIGERPSGRPRGVAVVATAPGERHALPGSMAAMALRADRWQVHHLGTEVPPDDLLDLAVDVAARLVVLSVSYPPARREGVTIGQVLGRAGIRCLVGRPGASLGRLVGEARSS